MLNIFHKIFPESEQSLKNKFDLLNIENEILDEADKGNVTKEVKREKDENKASVENCETSPTTCLSRQGTVTFINDEYAVLDNKLQFNRRKAKHLFSDISVGCVVEYLAYKNDDNEEIIVKIIQITEEVWEEEDTSKIAAIKESLNAEKPTFYNVTNRKILGIITEASNTSVEIETDYGEIDVSLSKVLKTFTPRKGDNVALDCTIQLNDDYGQGEILEVSKISPGRLETFESCVVESVFEDFAVLHPNIYVLKADMPKELHLGDIVQADLIECQHLKYVRRAIHLSILEKNFGKINQKLPGNSNGKSHAVSIIGNQHIIISNQYSKQNTSLKIKNNRHQSINLQKIEIDKTRESQIKLVEPLNSRRIDAYGEITVTFSISANFIGEWEEFYTLVFDTFETKQRLTIAVCDSAEDAKKTELRLLAAERMKASGYTIGQRSRHYANQVWSMNQKGTIISGRAPAPRTQFKNDNKSHAIRLDSHEVPEYLREILLTSDRRGTIVDTLKDEFQCLKGCLCMDNYRKRFQLLLHLEEIEQTVNFRNYDRERAHFQREKEYLSLQIENLAERRPSLVIGDMIIASSPWLEAENLVLHRGFIHKVCSDRVFIKFDERFQQKYNGEDYHLTFQFSRYTFRKQHHGLKLATRLLNKNLLFPNELIRRDRPQLKVTFTDGNMFLDNEKLKWYDTTLNSIQKRAVFNILRGEVLNLPYVIYGPPGTGKTVTLVETLVQLVENLPGVRILVGTPSNSSANLITKRIVDGNLLENGQFIRLVSHNQVERDLIPEELKQFCATLDVDKSISSQNPMGASDAGVKLRPKSKFVINHRVIIGTCATLGNIFEMDLPENHFTHVLIDEAGQCTEPETIMPIVLGHKSQIVLVGDHNQLQPITFSRQAAELGMDKSFLERILSFPLYQKDLTKFPKYCGYNPAVVTKLLNNYRALPSVMSVYNKLFYDEELVPVISDESSREASLLKELQTIFGPEASMPYKHGAFFYGILGVNAKAEDSPSWFNMDEAREVFLTTLRMYQKNIQPDQIGIITPYSKQVKNLRSMFVDTDIKMPKIGTVEEFQGLERDIILISTVRSTKSLVSTDLIHNLGFVSSKKRMNVATSRARCFMIVFGNPNLLSYDIWWRYYITYCANNNAYFGCELPSRIVNGHDDDVNN